MPKITLITGGAGFIGSNYTARLLSRGEKVLIYDNLARHGAPENLEWLRKRFGDDAFQFVKGDVRDAEFIRNTAKNADVIVHLAAQVAVTTSVTNPREDFEINAQGTFNVLEAARLSGKKPVVIYASTNKVYGGMEEVRVLEGETRYQYADLPLGVPEEQCLDFHSPYGCSKGAGDQYCRDYYRMYGIPTVVFRQSCIYGERQFGIEDQGWVAWFVIAALTGRKITIYGDGKQVRDILFVDDLVNAYDAAQQNIKTAAGQVFNVGGGPQNVMSVWADFGPLLEELVGAPIPIKQGEWRPGDQRIYVSDIRKAKRELMWSPKISVEMGIRRLFEWAKNNRSLF